MALPLDPQTLLNALSANVLRLIIAVLFLLFGFIIGRLAGKFLLKMMKEIEINKMVYETFRIKLNLDQLLSSVVSIVIYFFAIVAALEQLQLANTLLYLLSFAIIIVAVVSTFLAVRDFFPNLISGFYLHTRERFKEGVNIEVGDIKGQLVHIDLMHTKIKTKSGDLLFIPNDTVAKSKIKILKN